MCVCVREREFVCMCIFLSPQLFCSTYLDLNIKF